MNPTFTKLLFLMSGIVLALPGHAAIKRLKSFSNARTHYVAELSYDELSRINKVDVHGIMGDSEGDEISQILSIDWNELENGSLSMNADGEGPFRSEKMEFSSDGFITASKEYWIYSNGSTEITECAYSYYPDGYCSEMIMGTNEPERFIYYWNNGDLVKIDVEYESGLGTEVSTTTADYMTDVYPHGAEIAAAIIDDEVMDSEFPWTAIFSGKMKSSNHFVSNTGPSFRYAINFSVDEDGYPIHVVIVNQDYNQEYNSIFFEWEEFTGLYENVIVEQPAETYYTIDGILRDAPVKGINIVRYADGAIKKLIVK